MKNFNRNPEGNNQWEARSDAEVQRIIDQKPIEIKISAILKVNQ